MPDDRGEVWEYLELLRREIATRPTRAQLEDLLVRSQEALRDEVVALRRRVRDLEAATAGAGIVLSCPACGAMARGSETDHRPACALKSAPG